MDPNSHQKYGINIYTLDFENWISKDHQLVIPSP